MGQLLDVERAVDPDRGWRPGPMFLPTEQCQALLEAALLDCRRCEHLKLASTAQPAFARLAARWIDCEGCAQLDRQSRPNESDRCDVCGARGVHQFWPLRLGAGTLVVLGDCCDACHGVQVGAQG
jgi:hypothetical protein